MIELRREAERWLAARGITQWTEKWVDVANDKAERAVRQQQAWVVTADDETAATITLGGPDEDLWRPEDGPALYMYKLIVARANAGDRLGEDLMIWAADFAARYGYPCLRLDCWPANQGLVQYYKQRGWTLVRTVNAPGRDTGTLMERAAVRGQTRLIECDAGPLGTNYGPDSNREAQP